MALEGNGTHSKVSLGHHCRNSNQCHIGDGAVETGRDLRDHRMESLPLLTTEETDTESWLGQGHWLVSANSSLFHFPLLPMTSTFIHT